MIKSGLGPAFGVLSSTRQIQEKPKTEEAERSSEIERFSDIAHSNCSTNLNSTLQVSNGRYRQSHQRMSTGQFAPNTQVGSFIRDMPKFVINWQY